MSTSAVIELFHTRTSAVQLKTGAHVLITALVDSGDRRSFVHVLLYKSDDDQRTDLFENKLVTAGEKETDEETPASLEAFLVLRYEAEAHVRRLLGPLLTAPLPFHTATHVTTSHETGELVMSPFSDWLVDSDAFTRYLQPHSEIIRRTPAASLIPVVDTSDIEITDGILIGCAKMVQKVRWGGSTCAFKSLPPTCNDFHQGFENYSEGEIRSMVDRLYHEIKILSNLPSHPNLPPAPLALVKTSNTTPDPLIFGFISPFYPGGSLQQTIKATSYPLRLLYTRQLTSVVAFLHHVAHTFHGDIKLDNILFKDERNIVLIDFEQMRPNEDAAAPELFGKWDVELDSQGKLEYTPHTGSERLYIPADQSDAEINWKPFEAWAIRVLVAGEDDDVEVEALDEDELRDIDIDGLEEADELRDEDADELGEEDELFAEEELLAIDELREEESGDCNAEDAEPQE
ncbi:hypothetical protein P7C70_g5880, partial [Phenoliferia sp. Uapishka_3]